MHKKAVSSETAILDSDYRQNDGDVCSKKTVILAQARIQGRWRDVC
jgi:hypothetical protein